MPFPLVPGIFRRAPLILQKTADAFDVFRRESFGRHFIRWRFIHTVDNGLNRDTWILEDARDAQISEDGWIIGPQRSTTGAHELAISEIGKGDFVGTVHGNTLVREILLYADGVPVDLDAMATGETLPAETLSVRQEIDLYEYNTATGTSDPANYTGETRFGRVSREWTFDGKQVWLEQDCKTIAFTSRAYYLAMLPLNPDLFTEFSWDTDHSTRFTLGDFGDPDAVIIAPSGAAGMRAYGLDGSVTEIEAIEGWNGSRIGGYYLSLERKSDGRAKVYFSVAGFGSSNTVAISEDEVRSLKTRYSVRSLAAADIDIPGDYVKVADVDALHVTRNSNGNLTMDFTSNGFNPLLAGLGTAATIRVRAAEPVTVDGELYGVSGDYDLFGGAVSHRGMVVSFGKMTTQKGAAIPPGASMSSPTVKAGIYVKDELPRVRLIDAVDAQFRTAGNGNLIINFTGTAVADAGLENGDILAIVPATEVTIDGSDYQIAGVYPAALVTDDEIYILAANLTGEAATIPAGSSFSNSVATTVLRDRTTF